MTRNLSHMVNLFLQTTLIPNYWRRDIASHTTEPKLFRSISLTSVGCRALEAILKEEIDPLS